MSTFDESKVRREQGKFANQDSMRDEAGQVDAFGEPLPPTKVIEAQGLREGDRILHDGIMRDVVSIDGDHKDMTIELDDDDFITVGNEQLVEVAKAESAAANEVYDNDGAVGDYSLGKTFAVTKTWPMPDGTFRTAETTFYVTASVTDPEDYDYEDAEFEGNTIPSTGNLDWDQYESWRSTRASLEAMVSEAEAQGRVEDANAARRRLDEMPSIGFSVESMTGYSEHTDPEDIGGTETNADYEYNDHSMVAHWNIEAAERQAKGLAEDTNWDNYEPDNFFNR